MEGWMDGWMNRQMDGWMDGCMDGWMDRWMEGWMDRWMEGWMDRWMEGWMNGWLFRSPGVLSEFSKKTKFIQIIQKQQLKIKHLSVIRCLAEEAASGFCLRLIGSRWNKSQRVQRLYMQYILPSLKPTIKCINFRIYCINWKNFSALWLLLLRAI